MRKSALHRNASIIIVALAAAALSSVAVLAGSVWALPFIIVLATMAGLEFSARRGRAVASTVTQEALLQQLSRPVVATAAADAQMHSLDAHRGEDSASELPEGHLASVVQVDFRRRCAA